jgi:hypothetical protein
MPENKQQVAVAVEEITEAVAVFVNNLCKINSQRKECRNPLTLGTRNGKQ